MAKIAISSRQSLTCAHNKNQRNKTFNKDVAKISSYNIKGVRYIVSHT